jgi:hypothetical protein
MRWDKNLSTTSKDNLLGAKAQLEWLRTATLKLTLNPSVPNARQLSAMQEKCGRIRDVFIEEHASAMRRNDEADHA